MKYVELDKKYILSLADKNKDLAKNYQAYLEARNERRLMELIHAQQFEKLAEQNDQRQTEKSLTEFLERTDAEKQESFRSLATKYQALNENVRKQFYSGNPLYSNRQAFLEHRRFQLGPPDNCENLSPPYDFPLFCPFKEVRYLDAPGALFTNVVSPTPGVLPSGALNLTAVHITAWGQGKTAWISASWCFKPPTEIEICKFTLTAHMTVDGILDNKAGSSVRVQMDAGITQYRVDKPWDEINPAADAYFRNLRAPCQDPGNTLYTQGYVDDTYGLHGLTPLRATVSASFMPYAMSPCYGYEDTDTFFVGYWCEIEVGSNSAIQFEHNNVGTIVMHKPRIDLYTPTVP